MLVLGKKIDYALISLAWLRDRDGQYVSAREIAESNGLPLPALMQILKTLHQTGVLQSTRGVKGGYQIGVDLDRLSLLDLSQLLTAADSDEPGDDEDHTAAVDYLPLQAMRKKLSQFLQDVTVSEVIRPASDRARRIDVPLENLRILDRLTV
jgi:Rrf2 family protein